MLHAQPLREQEMVRRDHIVVIVLGKMCMHAIAGLQAFPVADPIGQDDEVALDIERLPGSVQFVSELWREELFAGSACSVKNKNRIRYDTLRVASGLTQGAVVKAQLRHLLAGAELEVMGDEVTFGDGKPCRLSENFRDDKERKDKDYGAGGDSHSCVH